MASLQSPNSTNSSQNGNDDDEMLELTPIDNYNAEEGKMQASISWLIAKVYGSNVPDQLVHLFTKDKDKIGLKPLVIQCLVSGELYCSAASTIFHDSTLINQSHGTVLQALHRYQIDVVDGTTGVSVTETMLRQDAPFKLHAHLAMIDGLMTAHMREVISVERVVEAVRKYTNVHRNEQPVDVEDAILFWINKICAAVRDNLGYGKQNNQEAPLIPEMDDLYEDICDGTCAATVVHFYHPDRLPFHEICFNDPISIGDMAHNLRLLKRFCQRHLPWNVFHFSLEDILYMHESLKPNVNAFFADLFYLLEVHQDSRSSAQKTQQKPKRGLPEKVEIPNLRSGSSGSSSAKDRIALAKPTKGIQSATMNLRRDTTTNSLATSRLNSTDSLATDRSVDSLRYRPYVGSSTESPLTGTGSHGSPISTRNFALPLTLQNPERSGDQLYQRSDSMPVRPGGPSAAIRLQLEQKRRQYEQQRLQQGSKLAEERQQRSKEAFFTLLGKSLSNQQMTAPGMSAEAGGSPAASSLLRKKAATPTAETAPSIIGQGGGRVGNSNLHQLAEFSKSIHELRQEMKRLSFEQEKLNKIMEPTPVVVSLGIGTGSPPTMTYAAPNFAQYPMGQQTAQFQVSAPIPSPYAAGQFQVAPGSTAYGMNASPGVQQQFQQQGFMPPASSHLNGASPSLSQLHMARAGVDQQQAMMPGASGATFKLHSEGETLSRLDPSLELTKTMTNWGMTYRIPQKPQRKTWGEQSFANAAHQQQQQQHGDFGQQQALFSPGNHHPNAGMMADFAAANDLQQQQQMLLVQHQQLQQLQQQQQQLLGQAAMMQGDIHASEASMYDGSSAVEMVPSEPEFTAHHIAPVGVSPSSVMTTSGGDIRAMRTSTDAITGQTMAAAAMSPTNFYAEAGGSGSSKSSTPAPADLAVASGLSREASPGVGFVIGEDDRRKELELQKKKEQIMSNALRRREQMEQRRAQADAEQSKKREEKQMQEEAEEQKKKEKELHRQKIWQEYQRRKAEQDALDSSGASTSGGPGTPQTSRTLPRNQQQRNHSQPPQRPKSQVLGGKLASPGMVPSGSADNLDQLDNKSQSSDGTGSGPTPMASSVVPAEPTLKLFVKPSQKTNRNLVLNAIQYCVLAGAVNEPTKQKVLTELAKSDSKHFLILFRDKKCQFKALYSWDQVSDTAHKLFGLGPPSVSEKTMELMFKYDSGAKQFSQIPTRHLSAQIDGFTVKDEYWQKKKPLYSTTRP